MISVPSGLYLQIGVFSLSAKTGCTQWHYCFSNMSGLWIFFLHSFHFLPNNYFIHFPFSAERVWPPWVVSQTPVQYQSLIEMRENQRTDSASYRLALFFGGSFAIFQISLTSTLQLQAESDPADPDNETYVFYSWLWQFSKSSKQIVSSSFYDPFYHSSFDMHDLSSWRHFGPWDWVFLWVLTQVPEIRLTIHSIEPFYSSPAFPFINFHLKIFSNKLWFLKSQLTLKVQKEVQKETFSLCIHQICYCVSCSLSLIGFSLCSWLDFSELIWCVSSLLSLQSSSMS